MRFSNIIIATRVLPTSIGMFALALLFVLGPTFGLWLHVDRYNDQRASQVIVLCVVGFLLVWHSLVCVHNNQVIDSRFNAFIVGLTLTIILSGLLAAVHAEHTMWALQEWALWVLLAALTTWVALSQFSAQNTFDCFAGLLFISSLFYSAVALIGFFIELSVLKEFSTRFLWTVGFENQRFLTAYLAIPMPLFACAWKLKSWNTARPFLVLIGGFTILVCVMAQSRGVFLFFLGVTLAFGLISLAHLKIWGRFIALSALCAVFLGVIMFWLPTHFGWQLDVVGQRQTFDSIVTLSFRDVIWRTAWLATVESNGLGIGPMMIASRPNGGLGAHPHNIYLQVLAEWGVVAFACGGWLCLKALHALFVSARAMSATEATVPKLQCSAMFATYCGMILYSLVDGFWVYPLTATIGCMLIGLGIRLHRSYGQATNDVRLHQNPTKALHLAQILLVVVAIGILARSVPTQLAEISDDQRAYYSAHPKESFNPRFWMQGWINWQGSKNAK